MKKIIFITLILIAFVLLGGCTRPPAAVVEPEANVPKLKVYTSFYPLYDFAGKIGGERIELVNMIPAGIEPHDWEPGPQKIAGLLQADVFFFNGFGLEPWVNKIVESLEAQTLMVVNTSDGIQPLYGYSHNDDDEEDHDDEDEENNELPDPHVWLDPILALNQAESIFNAFIKLDPDYADYYQRNFQQFREQMQLLDMAYSDSFSNPKRHKFIVTHLSFAYLAQRYGLEQIGINGLSPHSEPSPGQLKEVVDFARRHEIKHIFQEPLTDTRFAAVLAAEIGAEVLSLNPLEGLTEREQAGGTDYFTVMYVNLEQLKKALVE